MYKDAEIAQEKAGLPSLIGGRFPRFLETVDDELTKPITQVKKASLKHLTSINVKTSPWQSQSDVAFEFWRRITSIEVRTTNPKCDIKFEVLNTEKSDLVTCKYIDGETLIFETNHLKIHEVWY